MISSMLNDTVTVHHHSEGTADDYGNVTDTWATSTEYAGRLEQRTGAERTVDRDTQIAEWVLYLPAGAEISGRDRVESDGVTFEVVGPPVRHKARRGEHHVEVSLVVSDG